jgi:dipeptidyl aminopeptidase/acylaminoacyl peptidase
MRLIVLVVTAWLVGGLAIAQTPPSIADYAAMPNMSNVRISPDGERVLFISGDNWESRSIIVTRLDGTGTPIVIDVGDDQTVSRVFFLNDTHIWLTYTDRRAFWGMDDEQYVPRKYIMRIEDQQYLELDFRTRFASIDEDDPDSVLTWQMTQRAGGGVHTRTRGGTGYSLFRQNLEQRTRSRVGLGTRDFSYLLNSDDELVARQRGGWESDDPYELWARLESDDGWRQVHLERSELSREFHFAGRHDQEWLRVVQWVTGLDSTGRYGYFYSRTRGERGTRNPGDRWAMYRFDLLEEVIEGPIVESDMSDVHSTIRDWRNNAVIGVEWSEERNRVHYFEPEFAALQTQIEGFFPNSNVSLVSWDRDFNRVIVHLEGGHTAGTYYLVDQRTGEVAMISLGRPRVPDSTIAPVEVVPYTTRDGLSLFGYLTTPVGRDAADLPLVLMPHGGPEARDIYGYDEWSQLLASRGYAVFQPQFRGSGGFGEDFAEAGYENWGQEMQHDLDDGVDHLVEAGIVDPDRVCIFGWSYGGYAALAGMTLTPERYRCGVAGAGVSDIIAMMEYENSRFGGMSWTYWARNIGDWRGNHAAGINAVSPALHAPNIQAPLMIIHGTDDIVVDFHQAELMVEAMEAAGKPYEFIPIEGGRHYSDQMTVDHKLQLYENLLRFLDEHNPAD